MHLPTAEGSANDAAIVSCLILSHCTDYSFCRRCRLARIVAWSGDAVSEEMCKISRGMGRCGGRMYRMGCASGSLCLCLCLCECVCVCVCVCVLLVVGSGGEDAWMCEGGTV